MREARLVRRYSPSITRGEYAYGSMAYDIVHESSSLCILQHNGRDYGPGIDCRIGIAHGFIYCRRGGGDGRPTGDHHALFPLATLHGLI